MLLRRPSPVRAVSEPLRRNPSLLRRESLRRARWPSDSSAPAAVLVVPAAAALSARGSEELARGCEWARRRGSPPEWRCCCCCWSCWLESARAEVRLPLEGAGGARRRAEVGAEVGVVAVGLRIDDGLLPPPPPPPPDVIVDVLSCALRGVKAAPAVGGACVGQC